MQRKMLQDKGFVLANQPEPRRVTQPRQYLYRSCCDRSPRYLDNPTTTHDRNWASVGSKPNPVSGFMRHLR